MATTNNKIHFFVSVHGALNKVNHMLEFIISFNNVEQYYRIFSGQVENKLEINNMKKQKYKNFRKMNNNFQIAQTKLENFVI